eukprot:TRINITY_DN2612_c0_g1_i1.p1 TRINITY_DN2612_c0_g1~~TRINITY_DN2612_c0_g1_i1.p1  ORF type:complete len:396 (+),score=84.33 TRINITY_DN2612_c0_g1_i1:45-1232(+)
MIPLQLLWKWIYINFDAPTDKKKGSDENDAPAVSSLPKKLKLVDLDTALDEFFSWDELAADVKESKTAKITAKALIPLASQLVHEDGQFFFDPTDSDNGSTESQGTQSQEMLAPNPAKKLKFYLARITQTKKKSRLKDVPEFPEEFKQKLLNHLRTEIMGRKSNSGGSLAQMNPNNSPTKPLLSSQVSFLSNSNATISPSSSMPDLSKQPTLNLNLFSDSPALSPSPSLSSMSSAGGSTLAKTMSIPPPPQPQQVTGTKRALPDEDSDRPKKKARTEKKEGTRGRKKKEDEDQSYSEEEHSQTPPLSRMNSLGEDFDVNARLRLLEDQQKQMEQQLEALKGELLMKDFVFKPVSQIASTMADPQVKEKLQEKEEPKQPKKRGRPLMDESVGSEQD